MSTIWKPAHNRPEHQPMLVKNCWYVAALGRELVARPLGRRILDEPIVMYRNAKGEPVALEDRCCHRGLPLSMGEIIDGTIRCNYHGLEFDDSGRCIRIPSQRSIPPSAKVRRYPVVERGLVVWIWIGSPDLADPNLIPDYPWHIDPGWAWKSKVFHIRCDYQMLIDNLLDLSHVAYVHRYTIGGDPEIHFNPEMKISRTEESIAITRWMLNSNPPPTYAKLVDFDGKVDRWQEIEFTPGLISLYSGALDVGKNAYDGNREGGFHLRLFDAVTPETETTTHNIFCVGHNFRIDEPAVTDLLFSELEATVLEDIEVLEAQQNRIDEQPDRPFVDIKSDTAGNAARRILRRMYAEQA